MSGEKLNTEILENYKRNTARKELYKDLGYDTDKERAFIVEKARPLYGKILEVGTGKGHFTLALAKEGHPFISLDISEEEQRFAKLNLAYFGLEKLVDFRIGNAEHTGFADQSFDIIFSVNLLHHLHNPCKATDELIRILTPNGKLIISDFSKEGFRVVDKIHALEGRIHEAGKTTLADIEIYLIDKGFNIQKYKSRFQEVIIAYRKIK